jgi:hypothetical protein
VGILRAFILALKFFVPATGVQMIKEQGHL